MNLVISPQTIFIHGKWEYRLDGIICHAGIHYYAKLRNGERWCIFNDASPPQFLTDLVDSPEHYIFMYTKRAKTYIPTFIPTAEWQELPKGEVPLPRYVEQKLSLAGSRQARISPAYQSKIIEYRQKTNKQESDIKHEIENYLK